jgi:hypothetical protein
MVRITAAAAKPTPTPSAGSAQCGPRVPGLVTDHRARTLEQVLRVYVEHCNGHRPHSALQLESPDAPSGPAVIGDNQRRELRRDRLSGLFDEYHRQAAGTSFCSLRVLRGHDRSLPDDERRAFARCFSADWASCALFRHRHAPSAYVPVPVVAALLDSER